MDRPSLFKKKHLSQAGSSSLPGEVMPSSRLHKDFILEPNQMQSSENSGEDSPPSAALDNACSSNSGPLYPSASRVSRTSPSMLVSGPSFVPFMVAGPKLFVTVTLAHLLAACEDLSKIIRRSSGISGEKTACAINKVLMGRVPDPGGRPNEIEPPPPECPFGRRDKKAEGGVVEMVVEEVLGVEKVDGGVEEGKEEVEEEVEESGEEVVGEGVAEVSKAGEIMVGGEIMMEEGTMVGYGDPYGGGGGGGHRRY